METNMDFAPGNVIVDPKGKHAYVVISVNGDELHLAPLHATMPANAVDMTASGAYKVSLPEAVAMLRVARGLDVDSIDVTVPEPQVAHKDKKVEAFHKALREEMPSYEAWDDVLRRCYGINAAVITVSFPRNDFVAFVDRVISYVYTHDAEARFFATCLAANAGNLALHAAIKDFFPSLFASPATQPLAGSVLKRSCVYPPTVHAMAIEGLVSAYYSHARLDLLVGDVFSVRLDALAGSGSILDVAEQLLRWAYANGEEERLMVSAWQKTPGNSYLRKFMKAVYPAQVIAADEAHNEKMRKEGEAAQERLRKAASTPAKPEPRAVPQAGEKKVIRTALLKTYRTQAEWAVLFYDVFGDRLEAHFGTSGSLDQLAFEVLRHVEKHGAENKFFKGCVDGRPEDAELRETLRPFIY